MDDADNKPQDNAAPETAPESAPEAGVEAADSAAKAAAREAAADVKAGAQETLNQVRSIRFKDFLTFDKMVFPRIATILFYLFCALTIISGLFGILGCVISLVQGKILNAMIGAFMTVIFTIVFIVLTRIWFEVVLVAFKIHEGVQDIRELLLKKFQ